MASRKRKGGAPRSVEDGRDKPAFAADWFASAHASNAEPKKAKPDVAEQAATLSDHLDSRIASKLQAMKATLVQAEEVARANPGKRPGGPAAGANKRPVAGTKGNAESSDIEKVSFGELFNPTDPDEESFETMLKDSKLDWRSFKDNQS